MYLLARVISHDRVGNQITKNMVKLANKKEPHPIASSACVIQGGGLVLVFFQNCDKFLRHFIGDPMHICSASYPMSVMSAISLNTVVKIRKQTHCKENSIIFPTIPLLESLVLPLLHCMGTGTQLRRPIRTSKYLHFQFLHHDSDLQPLYITQHSYETISL